MLVSEALGSIYIYGHTRPSRSLRIPDVRSENRDFQRQLSATDCAEVLGYQGGGKKNWMSLQNYYHAFRLYDRPNFVVSPSL